MCMQCYAAAASAVGAATGSRVWLVARFGHLLTPARRRALTVALLSLAVLAAGVGLGGSG